tara:strand:- start:1523 stop:1741 length:219 start_codon:yes stop_codon:yes gene_type:complete
MTEMKLTKKQITVSTDEFRWAHGKAPRGIGGWAFDFNFKIRESAPRGTYAEAKKWAINRAIELHTTHIEVCS